MSRALVVLDSRFQRQKAADWCWSLKDGTRVEFKAPQRTDDQNSMMWVLLTKVSVQLKWHGLKLTPDDWKLQFLDALRRAHGEQIRVVPNTDNSGFVSLGTSSSDLSKDEMSDLIELIYKFGAEHGVKFNEPYQGPSDASLSSGAVDAPVVDQGAEASPPFVSAPDLSGDEPETKGDEAPAKAVHGEQSASSPDLNQEERDWLRQGAKMLWAATGKGEQDVLAQQKKAVLAMGIPEAVRQDARDRLNSIFNKCKLVCFGERDTGEVLLEIAMSAGCEPKEIV